MMRKVLYVAHPLRPSEEEIEIHRSALRLVHSDQLAGYPPERIAGLALKFNLQRALRWLAWLRKSFPETTFIAPWIASVMSGEDDARRPGGGAVLEAGMRDNEAVIERCDGIVLCGGRISSGMEREMAHGLKWRSDPDRGTIMRSNNRDGRPSPPFAAYDLTFPQGPEPPLTFGPLMMTLEELADTARDLWRR